MAISAPVIVACKLLLETKEVVRVFPFHSTTEDDMKLDPFTVSRKLVPPATVELGLSEPVARDGAGLDGGST